MEKGVTPMTNRNNNKLKSIEEFRKLKTINQDYSYLMITGWDCPKESKQTKPYRDTEVVNFNFKVV